MLLESVVFFEKKMVEAPLTLLKVGREMGVGCSFWAPLFLGGIFLMGSGW